MSAFIIIFKRKEESSPSLDRTTTVCTCTMYIYKIQVSSLLTTKWCEKKRRESRQLSDSTSGTFVFQTARKKKRKEMFTITRKVLMHMQELFEGRISLGAKWSKYFRGRSFPVTVGRWRSKVWLLVSPSLMMVNWSGVHVHIWLLDVVPCIGNRWIDRPFL
jgi:hypothetical protein